MSVQFLVSSVVTDLTGFFRAVATEPFAMLLDSAAPGHPNSRYDILVCRPLACLTAVGRHCQVHYSDAAQSRDQVSDADPFALLKQLQLALLPQLPADVTGLPFVGGAVGFFGYDLGRVTEKMPELALADIKVPDLAIGIYRHALVLDKQLKQLWFVDAAGQAEHQFPLFQPLFADALQSQPHQPSAAGFALTTPWQANMSQTDYLQKFDRIQQYLQSGDCYQINLAQRFTAGFQGDAYSAYLQLRQANQAPFSAFIRLADAAVLSISPERFIEVRSGQVETKPIKGTKPRFTDPLLDTQSAEALRQSAKDRAENVMIVDLLRNDLGKVCTPGTVRVPALFAIESFPAVHHLVSTVTGQLDAQHQPIDALRAAFPGGSITGAPKVRAMQIIEELEPHRRSVYCGAIGYISQHGHMDTNIAIRTLVVADQQIHCWAGGGIVADSQGAAEYQETYDKVGKILPVLLQDGGHHP
ncbi:MAG: aminodeoxychorismate synthase component I [Rheinheimera sp.]|nr:aminodeoxychorismate synthase component I [Rheinheimera sp.]